MGTFEQTETERRLANLAQIGVVAEVELGATPKAKVRMGEFVTGWLRMGTRRAGDASESWAYSVGEEVLVISTSGDFAQGVIICAIANAQNPAAAEEGAYKIGFPGDVVLEISGGVVFIDAPGGAVINGDTQITGDVQITGMVDVTGEVEVSGDVTGNGISLATHKHGGILPGGATTGGPQ